MRTGSQRSGRTVLVAALLPALFAVWLYGPVWNGGLLADDLMLMRYLTVPVGDTVQIDWQRVLDDFHGPWAFGQGAFYRPFVTLVMACGYWLADGGEWVFHTLSIGLLAATVFALARLFGELFGARGSWFGGFLFAAHPANHEPICWPCTCADFLVLIAAATACTSFVRYLRDGRRRDLRLTMGVAVLAMLSKETGVLLAVWLLLLDLGVRGRGVPFASRLRLHLRLVPLWALYLGWRWWILDSAIGERGPLPWTELLAMWPWLQAVKLQACVLPMGSRMPAATPFVMAALALWLLAGSVVRENRRWLWVALSWLVVSLLPVQWHVVLPNLGRSRYVLTGLTGFVLLAAAVAGWPRAPQWFRLAGTALLASAVVCLAAGTRTLQQAYELAWQQMRTLRQQVDVAAEATTVSSPLVWLGGLRDDDEIYFLLPEMAYSIAERPLVAADRPFVGLGHVIHPGIGAELMDGDVTVWRAWWQHGAPLVHWSAVGTHVKLTHVTPPAASPAIELDPAPNGFAVRGGSAPPWPIAAVEVVADRAFDGGVLTWRDGGGGAHVVAIGAAQRRGDGWSAVVDLEAHAPFVMLGIFAGIAGFDATLSPATVPVRSLHVRSSASPAPVPQPLRGERLPLDDLPPRLPWTIVPADAEPGSARLVLMNKSLAMRIPVAPGEPLVLPEVVRPHLAQFDRTVRELGLHYYYLEARVGGRWWHTEIDWFERAR